MKREVAILTKSSKYKGYCVAGIDINTGEWVRFVSDNVQTHGALSVYDISYANRCICKPLDVVRVDVVGAAPLAHQPENYLIDSHEYWRKTGECTLSDVLAVHPAEVRPYLYGNLSPFVDGEEIDGLIEEHPYYARATIPGGMYRGNEQPVDTFGVRATMVTSAQVPEETVYQTVKAVFDNFDRFKRLHPAFAELTEQEMIKEGLSIPLHDGAVRYYRERGWM